MASEVKVETHALNEWPLKIDPSNLAKLEKAKEEFNKRRKVVLNSIPDDVDLEDLKRTIIEGLNAVEVTIDKQTVTILFKNTEEAEQGVETLKTLSSDFKDRGISITTPQPDSLLFVGNLSLEFTDEEFEKLMSQYGKLERILLVRSEVTGESKGYGFVEYSDRKTAGEAKQKLLNSGAKYIAGRILRVDFAEPNLHTYKDLHSRTLFLDKLPRDFTDGEVLKELFGKTGTVTFAQVAIHPQSGTSRGFAFVDYATSEEAEKGQIAHNGALIGTSNIRTSYGTPGRLGAHILDVPIKGNTTQKPKPGSLMSVVCPNSLIRPPPFRPPPVRHPLNPAVPLMQSPLMGVADQRAQMAMSRMPDPRVPMPLLRPGLLSEVGDPRAPLFQRLPGPRPQMPGMGGPRPQAHIHPPLPNGPQPLMNDGPIRQPCPIPMGGPRGFPPRGVPPRGMPAPPHPAGLRSAPIRPLMDGNHHREGPQPQMMKSEPRLSNPQARPPMNHVPKLNKDPSLLSGQSPQPLMQSGTTQTQQQQQQLKRPLYENNPHPVHPQVRTPLAPKPTLQSLHGHIGQSQHQQQAPLPGQMSGNDPRIRSTAPGLPGQNQQMPGNDTRMRSTLPEPLMSMSADDTGHQQVQAGSSTLSIHQAHPTAVNQSVPGQNTTSFPVTGNPSVSSYGNHFQTQGHQGTAMDQSYLGQQNTYQQQQQQQQGVGYVGQPTQSPVYQQSGQIQQQWQQQASLYGGAQQAYTYNMPAQMSSTLQTSSPYSSNQGSQASLQSHTQTQPNQYSANQTEPLLKQPLGDYYGNNKRPRY